MFCTFVTPTTQKRDERMHINGAHARFAHGSRMARAPKLAQGPLEFKIQGMPGWLTSADVYPEV
eukprot:12046848-Karenia_brevis.AAC.1